MIVHLNGWPGVGKLTVATILADRLGARLIDNHLLHDVAIRCAGIDDPARWPLYEAVRAAAYQVLAERPRSEILVMTNALCAGAPRECEAWRHVVDLAEARAAPLVLVLLERLENPLIVTSVPRVDVQLDRRLALSDDAIVDDPGASAPGPQSGISAWSNRGKQFGSSARTFQQFGPELASLVITGCLFLLRVAYFDLAFTWGCDRGEKWSRFGGAPCPPVLAWVQTTPLAEP